MANSIVVLVDLNVILDVLARRQPHYARAADLWARIERGEVGGLIAAHSATTLHYLLTRHSGIEEATSAVRDVLSVFGVAAVDGEVLQHALRMGWSDFEDAVQMGAGAKAGAEYLITRNPADFESGPIPVLGPAEFLPLVSGERD